MRLSRLGQASKATDSESRQLTHERQTRRRDHGDGRRVTETIGNAAKRVPQLTVNAQAISFIGANQAWCKAGAAAAKQVLFASGWKSCLDTYRKSAPAVAEHVVLGAHHGVTESRGRCSANGLHKLAATIIVDPLALQAHSHERECAADIEPVGNAVIAR